MATGKLKCFFRHLLAVLVILVVCNQLAGFYWMFTFRSRLQERCAEKGMDDYTLVEAYAYGWLVGGETDGIYLRSRDMNVREETRESYLFLAPERFHLKEYKVPPEQ